MAAKNLGTGQAPSFLGAGAYRHHVPASVDHLIQRGEFLTSYTPYQPEVTQGTLQYLFEFQTQVALLTGMDVANASMYDGATCDGRSGDDGEPRHPARQGACSPAVCIRITARSSPPTRISPASTAVARQPDPEGREDLDHADRRQNLLRRGAESRLLRPCPRPYGAGRGLPARPARCWSSR